MPTLMFTARTSTASSRRPAARRVLRRDRCPGSRCASRRPARRLGRSCYRHRGRLRRLTLGSADVLSWPRRASGRAMCCTHASKGADPADREAGRPEGRDDRRPRRPVHREVGEAAEAIAGRPTTTCSAARSCRTGGIGRSWTSRGRTCGSSSRQVAEAGAPIVANRVAALLSKLFAFALDRDLVDRESRRCGFRGRARSSSAIAC